MDYPIKLTRDDDGSLLATSKDFPELTTFGEDREDALRRAVGAIEEAIAGRIARRQEIPEPSKGRNRVHLPTQTEIKVLLYNAMREQGVRKSELARRLRCHTPQVDRLLNLRHASRMDQIESAFDALGARLSIEVESAE